MSVTVIVAWLVIGFVTGGLAYLLVPGSQRVGVLRLLISGLFGALGGGFITAVLIGAGHPVNSFIIALVVSVLGIRAVASPGYGRLESRARHLLRSH